MSIDFGRSFSFIVEDPRWLPKLSAIAGVSVATAVHTMVPITMWGLAALPTDELNAALTDVAELSPGMDVPVIPGVQPSPVLWLLLIPFFGGLGGLALLLGYYIELVRNVRLLVPHPMPPWDDWGSKLRDGAVMSVAYVGYLLANAAFFGVGLVLIRQVGGMNAEMVRLGLAFCCLIPLVLLNGFVIIFVTSIGVLPFSVGGRLQDFYRLGWVWRRTRQDAGLTGRWFLYGVLANTGFGVAGALPGIGPVVTFLSLFVSVLVQGHLLGQYAAALDERYGNALEV